MAGVEALQQQYLTADYNIVSVNQEILEAKSLARLEEEPPAEEMSEGRQNWAEEVDDEDEWQLVSKTEGKATLRYILFEDARIPSNLDLYPGFPEKGDKSARRYAEEVPRFWVSFRAEKLKSKLEAIRTKLRKRKRTSEARSWSP